MKESGFVIPMMDRVNFAGQMEEFMKVSGRMELLMGREFIPGLTVESTRDSIIATKSMDLESFHGKTAVDMKVLG